MKVEDILKVHIGTLLRLRNNKIYLVMGILEDSSISLPIVLREYNIKEKILQDNGLTLTISSLQAIIIGDLSKNDLLKLTLLGIQFEKECNWSKYYVSVSEIDENTGIVVTDDYSGNQMLYFKKDNKYAIYDIVKWPYVSNFRLLKMALPKYMLGNAIRLNNINPIVSTSTNVETRYFYDNVEDTIMRRIKFCVCQAKKLGTDVDFNILKLYVVKKDALYKTIVNYVIKEVHIREIYYYEELDRTLNIIIDNESCFNYDKYAKKYKKIIRKAYNYIISNLDIDAKKKLSTVAKELISKGRKITGYNTSISCENFFDIDTYIPFSIIDYNCLF